MAEYTKAQYEDWEATQKAARERMKQLTAETRPLTPAERLWGRRALDGNASRVAMIESGKVKR
jgi:hypothetical protein